MAVGADEVMSGMLIVNRRELRSGMYLNAQGLCNNTNLARYILRCMALAVEVQYGDTTSGTKEK